MIARSNPEVLDGLPLFDGTRVPVQALVEYLVENETLDAFLHDFPSVRRDQAVAFLHLANRVVAREVAV